MLRFWAVLTIVTGLWAAPMAASAQNLTINDVSQLEGDAGTTTFTFTVSLSTPAGPGGVVFDIATANGTALSGTDYVASTLVGQTIAMGASTYNFSVTVNGDTVVEPNETFFVNVTNVAGAVVADGQGQGTIQNDDVAPVPVPTLTEWAMIWLAVLLAGGAAIHLERRRRTT